MTHFLAEKQSLWKDTAVLLGAALLLFLLPAWLFRSRTDSREVKQTDKHTGFIFYASDVQSPGKEYLFKYMNPEDFLHPPEEYGFALFRTMETPGGGEHLPSFVPELPVRTPRKKMLPLPLPRRELAFPAPLIPEEELVPVPPAVKREYPLILTSGDIPVPDVRFAGLDPERYASSLRGPTRILVIPPLAADRMPWDVLLLESSGVPQLDQEAIRKVNFLLLNDSFRQEYCTDGFSIYWLPLEKMKNFAKEEKS